MTDALTPLRRVRTPLGRIEFLELIEAVRTYLLAEWAQLLRVEVANVMASRTPELPWASITESATVASKIDYDTEGYDFICQLTADVYANYAEMRQRYPGMTSHTRWAMQLDYARHVLTVYRELLRYYREVEYQ